MSTPRAHLHWRIDKLVNKMFYLFIIYLLLLFISEHNMHSVNNMIYLLLRPIRLEQRHMCVIS